MKSLFQSCASTTWELWYVRARLKPPFVRAHPHTAVQGEDECHQQAVPAGCSPTHRWLVTEGKEHGKYCINVSLFIFPPSQAGTRPMSAKHCSETRPISLPAEGFRSQRSWDLQVSTRAVGCWDLTAPSLTCSCGNPYTQRNNQETEKKLLGKAKEEHPRAAPATAPISMGTV